MNAWATSVPRRRARRTLLVVLLVAVGINDLINLAAEFAAPHAGGIDFSVYYRAAQALAHHGALYSTPPACCYNASAMSGYTYPPLFAFLMMPLTALSIDNAGRVWLVLDCLALVALLVIGIRAAPGRISLEARAWLVLLILTSGSVAGAIHEMQATPVVIALEAVFAWCIIQDRAPALGGFVLGLGTTIKAWPLLLAPAALRLPRRRATRVLVALAVTLIVALAVMFAVSPQLTFYVTRVLPSFSSGVVAPGNLSLPGVVLRSLAAAGVPPPSALRFGFDAFELAAIVVTLVICRGIPGKAGRALTVAGLLAIVPIVQGVTWNHHLIASILALVLVLPLMRAGSREWLLAVGGCVGAMIWQARIADALAAAGWNPPHNAIQFAVFVAAAALDLSGMCALWLGVMLSARRLRSTNARADQELIGRPIGSRAQVIGST